MTVHHCHTCHSFEDPRQANEGQTPVLDCIAQTLCPWLVVAAAVVGGDVGVAVLLVKVVVKTVGVVIAAEESVVMVAALGMKVAVARIVMSTTSSVH